MMILGTAVAILAALVLVDLVLTTAIVRRLRGIESEIIAMNTPPDDGLPVGAPMPEFVTPDGELTAADLAGQPALIGFFSAGCRHCPAQAEELAVRADELAGNGVRVVSVLTVNEGASDELSATLRKAGTLVTDPDPHGLMATFGEEATPVFLLFGDDGRLLGRGHALGEVLVGK